MVPQFGFTSMLDTMELMRKTWGQMNLPAAFAPTMDVDELDRRIKDLKAVEQWLTVNMNLLRSTIQGMEVQRGTIAALNAFGSALRTPAEPERPRARPERSPAGQTPPAQAAEPPAPREPKPGAPQGLRPEDADIEAARGRGAPAASEPGAAAAPGATGTASGAAETLMLDPTAWWNLLQQQFQQVAGSALAGVASGSAPSDADETQAGASTRPGKRRGPPRAQNEPTGAEASRTAARTPRRPGR